MAATYIVSTSGGTLIVRSAPDTSANAVGRLSNGTRVTVLEFRGDWRKIHSGGWVHGDYLRARATPSAQSGQAKLPSWADLRREYPDYINYSSAQVKSDIGGNVDAAWITNTCAVRLSRTLNYNSISVPSKFSGLHTVSGGDRMRYAFRVREIRKWLMSKLGKPAFDMTKKSGDAFDMSKIQSMKGIIGFDIRFSDATGHLDLTNGLTFSSEAAGMAKDYWTKATRIWIWKTG